MITSLLFHILVGSVISRGSEVLDAPHCKLDSAIFIIDEMS